MRITFKDVRIEKEITYFFMPSGYGPDMKYCLIRDGITDFEIVHAHNYKKIIPPHIEIPQVRMRIDGSDNFICKRSMTCALISNMNIDDLTQKLNQIQNCEDDDLNDWHALIITKPANN